MKCYCVAQFLVGNTQNSGIRCFIIAFFVFIVSGTELPLLCWFAIKQLPT